MVNNGCILVSWDIREGDQGDQAVLVVGERKGRVTKIVNAFQGQEALDLLRKLIGDDKKEY